MANRKVVIIRDGIPFPIEPGDTMVDGSGSPIVSGSSASVEETVSLVSTFADKYVDITNVPVNLDTVQLFVKRGSDYLSPLQLHGKDFRIVRHMSGGIYKRISWDSTSTPGSTAIPDLSDLAPTQGMQDILLISDVLVIFYLI